MRHLSDEEVQMRLRDEFAYPLFERPTIKPLNIIAALILGLIIYLTY